MSIKEHPPQHVPVLLEASLELLDPRPGERYLDLTAGYGGHAAQFLAKTGNSIGACLVDRDSFAIASLKRFEDDGVRLIHSDFATASQTLIDENQTFDCLLVDLGVSSPQLDRAERGFSFSMDGPLDMRMDNQASQTAADIVNTWKAEALADIIHQFGEEPRSVARRYAQAIVKARPFTTTGQLAEAILQAHIGTWQRIHPATRTFQAIRIVLNQELEQVEQLLNVVPQLLNKGGRVGIISFHSLEDRLVKRYFAQQAAAGYEAEFELINRKPKRGKTDDVTNPRARSATLRAARKT